LQKSIFQKIVINKLLIYCREKLIILIDSTTIIKETITKETCISFS